MADQAITQSPHEQAAASFEKSFGNMLGVKEAEGAPEPEQQPVEGLPEEGAQAGETATPETTDSGQEPPADESVDVEIEGEVWALPKKISKAFMQQADYTRKTQDLAELSRAVTAERETLQINSAFEQAVAAERQQAALLDAQLAQFKSVDWGSMGTEDLLRARAQFDRLKDDRSELERSIQAKRSQFGEQVNQARMRALQAGAKYIEQNIQGFDKAMQERLASFGQTRGFSEAELAKISDPRFVVLLHDAMQWHELKSSAPAVRNKAARASPVVRPGATQNQPSQKQVHQQRIRRAQTPKDKAAAIGEYFATSSILAK